MYEYSGLDFKQQQTLNIVEFMALARDAYISNHNRTKEGREYLEQCWINEQTKPDRGALREIFDVKEA